MAPHSGLIRPERLGSAAFRHDHGVRYAYVAGAMAKGIASVDLVARLGRAGLLGYYGSGGQRLDVVESAIRRLRSLLPDGQPFGIPQRAIEGQTLFVERRRPRPRAHEAGIIGQITERTRDAHPVICGARERQRLLEEPPRRLTIALGLVGEGQRTERPGASLRIAAGALDRQTLFTPGAGQRELAHPIEQQSETTGRARARR